MFVWIDLRNLAPQCENMAGFFLECFVFNREAKKKNVLKFSFVTSLFVRFTAAMYLGKNHPSEEVVIVWVFDHMQYKRGSSHNHTIGTLVCTHTYTQRCDNNIIWRHMRWVEIWNFVQCLDCNIQASEQMHVCIVYCNKKHIYGGIWNSFRRRYSSVSARDHLPQIFPSHTRLPFQYTSNVRHMRHRAQVFL